MAFKVWIVHTGPESKHRIAALGLGCLLFFLWGKPGTMRWRDVLEFLNVLAAEPWTQSQKPEHAVVWSPGSNSGSTALGRHTSASFSCCVWCRCLSCSPVLCSLRALGKFHWPYSVWRVEFFSAAVMDFFLRRKFMDFFWQATRSKLGDVKLPKLLIFSTQNWVKCRACLRHFIMIKRIWLQTEHLKETSGKESLGTNSKWNHFTALFCITRGGGEWLLLSKLGNIKELYIKIISALMSNNQWWKQKGEMHYHHCCHVCEDYWGLMRTCGKLFQ